MSLHSLDECGNHAILALGVRALVAQVVALIVWGLRWNSLTSANIPTR